MRQLRCNMLYCVATTALQHAVLRCNNCVATRCTALQPVALCGTAAPSSRTIRAIATAAWTPLVITCCETGGAAASAPSSPHPGAGRLRPWRSRARTCHDRSDPTNSAARPFWSAGFATDSPLPAAHGRIESPLGGCALGSPSLGGHAAARGAVAISSPGVRGRLTCFTLRVARCVLHDVHCTTRVARRALHDARCATRAAGLAPAIDEWAYSVALPPKARLVRPHDGALLANCTLPKQAAPSPRCRPPSHALPRAAYAPRTRCLRAASGRVTRRHRRKGAQTLDASLRWQPPAFMPHGIPGRAGYRSVLLPQEASTPQHRGWIGYHPTIPLIAGLTIVRSNNAASFRVTLTPSVPWRCHAAWDTTPHGPRRPSSKCGSGHRISTIPHGIPYDIAWDMTPQRACRARAAAVATAERVERVADS